MHITFGKVTETTPCPGVHSATLKHYPRTVAGRPVTMPYISNGLWDQHQIVMPSLCSRKYLIPPDVDDDPEVPVCVECRDRLANAHESRVSPRPRVPTPATIAS
ncbi:hypothetical protein LY12_003440 [Prauserella alba]|uniref:Zinc-finger n=1 Tax=Prauserella alba TaxID=176898 RepID=A0ABP4G8U3_9PSEU|nr:hypothetical protein [Prauserella alba]